MKNLFLFFALALGIVSMNSCSKNDGNITPTVSQIEGLWTLDSSITQGVVEYKSFQYTEKWDVDQLSPDTVSVVKHFFINGIDDNNPNVNICAISDSTILLSGVNYKFNIDTFNSVNTLKVSKSDESKIYFFTKN